MILVFYNESMDVCVLVYSIDGGLTLTKKEIFFNEDEDAELFFKKLGVVSKFIDKVLLNIQDRFEGMRVIIFDNSKRDSLYDREDLVDMLFVYRREIAVLKANITEEEAESVAEWLYKHYSL